MTGLSTAEARALFAKNGPNEVSEKRDGGLVRLLKALVSPASLMLMAASGLSFFIHRSFDGSFILALLVLNIGMSLWHSHKADKALAALKAQLSVNAKVMRDGQWRTIPSRELVVGDVIECGVGSLVPADARIDSAVNLEINDAVLTGESLPKEKKAGDTAYSGSVAMTGTFTGTVTATGNNAFFGKIAGSVAEGKRASLMERDILSISRFLIAASILAILVLTLFLRLTGQPLPDILLLDLSLLIAGIPVSLPTVMTLILSIGALALAERSALVRRLEALEDLANVTLLLTDKTGTLTENKISVERAKAYPPYGESDVLAFAAAAASADGGSVINRAVIERGRGITGSPFKVLDFVPADSIRKRSTTLLERDGERYLVSFGLPSMLATFADGVGDLIARDTADAAKDGSRAMAVAVKKGAGDVRDEKGMDLAGLLVLSDPLRADAAETISFLREQGVETVMVTGDTKETAARIAATLGLKGQVLRPADTDIANLTPEIIRHTAAFAEVLPEDKLAIVTRAQQVATVASTGDGVNDLPALRKADVGIAVKNAVDALKGTADIVLLDSGISVLESALIEARKIFFRLYNYSVYRISESFRLVVTALVLGILIKGFPLTPVQLILLAFLNDIPIITLAFDRVKRADRPADLAPRERYALGTTFGMVGVANSLIMYYVLTSVAHLPLPLVQTAFFLKLTVSGHMLIYVAHTKEYWWKYLPSPSIIAATTATQLAATALAIGGILVAPIPPVLALFVWAWAFFFMQVSEALKFLPGHFYQSVPKETPQTAAA